MFAQPQAEHHWLEQLVGRWTCESECRMAPDQPPTTARGTATCRSIGGLWSVIESQGESAECGAWQTIMSVGYDPAAGGFVGSFIGSMMANLWVYSGTLDEAKRRLVLDTTGPRCDGAGIGRYQDIIEIVGPDEWTLSSQMQGDDGTWQPFMTGRFRRVAGTTADSATADGATTREGNYANV